MKKNFYLLVVFSIFCFPQKVDGHVHFYVFGGFNSSKIITEFDNKETIFSEAKLNYNFGACFRFEIGNFFYLQPELYFTRKGGLEKSFRTSTFDSLDERVNMLSVDLPIMAGIRLFDNGSSKFALRLYGGPIVSFLQRQSDMNRVTIYKNGQVLPHTLSTHVFSMQMGAGLDIFRFTFDVRYEYAFSPLLSYLDLKTKHRIIYFTLGIRIF